MKDILALLSIILPALIVVLGLVRLFVSRPRFTHGLTMLFAILLLLIGLARYFLFPEGGRSSQHGPTPPPLSVSRHSEAFNRSVETLLSRYYAMAEGFVNWDTVVLQQEGRALAAAFDSVQLDELQADTLIYQTAQGPFEQAKAELSAILADPSWNEKRGSLNILSDNLRSFLTVIRYDRSKIYWQECPMAFGEDRPGNWLSPGVEVRNPYLGTKDPEYGDKMLHCGGPRDTLNFLQPDTLKH